ncbi:unnamed protein product (macronuclear) [Paramecium tetraurelia]|uniref:B box-type domain-containing protein n=1 Tax=Paramecium tetraurelia TaxID=5888 RepID=A0DDJ2_PARTE|nr:uncharacterized protein GSPATT00015969001 [Paramecium tetraurelia]CAK81109.1 unnamed protein product [Paramecium tetraurelia]|eukprot:XP_001448506.1 hypothetical protein (macronuclear) [Paramecium tetraurelia strain d4-2]
MQQQCECKIEGNMNVQIIGICLNRDCSEEWFCQNCVKNHDGHEKDLQSGDQMDQLLQQYNSAEYQKFLEADEKFQKLQEYYNRVLQGNQNDVKMLDNLQQFIMEENYQGINKYLDQFKEYKQQIDNNKPGNAVTQQFQLKYLRYWRVIQIIQKNQTFQIYLRMRPPEKKKKKQKKFLLKVQDFADFCQQNSYLTLKILMRHYKFWNILWKQIMNAQNHYFSKTLIQLELFENSINHCNQLIKINRQNFEVSFLKSIALLLIPNYDEFEEELQIAHKNSPYRFYCLILNLIEELEENCTVVKDFIQSLNFDLKKQLQSLIINNEIPSQTLKQQMSIIIQIIKLVDKIDLEKALFQFNQSNLPI